MNKKMLLFGMGSGLVVALAFVFTGGLSTAEARVAIEFGIEPELFEGLEVEIDGEIAGRLESTGRVTRRAFSLELGEHVIRIVHPEMRSEPRRVDLALRNQTLHLLADIEEHASAGGRSEMVLVLRR